MNIGTASARRKEREQEALRLHSEGLSIKQSAERMGVSIESVRRYLRSNGVPFVRKQMPRGKKLPCGSLKTCHALLVMLFEDGCGKSEIASICGCSESNVANYLIRSGMVRKKRRTITDSMKQEIAELASQGVSYYEIGEAYGMHHASVSRIARSAGTVRGKGGGCAAKNNAERAAKAAPARMERVRNAIGDRFEIVEETKHNWFVLKCRSCGHEFERHVDLNYPTTCPECRRIESAKREEERKAEREAEAKRSLMQKIVNILAHEHICSACGRRFRDANPSKLYCSSRCKNASRAAGYSARAKRFGVECDPSITLDAALRRFGYTCYLCGKTCTKEDKSWGSFGRDYPTIDHVIPMSKGGSHTWDNVRIACGECNSIKGAKIIDDRSTRGGYPRG